MSLVLTDQGCHTWVATAGAAGPILAIDGHRLADHTLGAPVARRPLCPNLPPPRPKALSGTLRPGNALRPPPTMQTPRVTTRAWVLPGTSCGVLELVRIGPLHLIVPDTPPQAWAQAHFAGAMLAHPAAEPAGPGHRRRHGDPPGSEHPGAVLRWYDVKAAYDVFDHPEATPDHIQAGHRRMVRDQLSQPGEYLLIEDTTAVSYRGRQPIAGLGSVGHSSEGQKAFQLHSVLAVRWPGPATPDDRGHRPGVEVLGLLISNPTSGPLIRQGSTPAPAAPR